MAGIDKIYGNRKQWFKLHRFCKRHRIKHRMYGCPPHDAEDWPLSNFGSKIDAYLWKHCKLDFVRKRLLEQHGGYPPRKRNLAQMYRDIAFYDIFMSQEPR